jgi:hypothetical protein
MKKQTYILSCLLFLGFAFGCSASLYNYYQGIGQTLPTIAQRAPLASSFGIVGYSGTSAQNNALESNLRASGTLGAGGTTSTVPTNKTPFLNATQTWTKANTFNGTTNLATTTFSVRPIGATGFAGTGVDGALNATSGTTTINLGGASVFTKNYSSISITGTGTVAFSNPNANGTTIILKSRGDVVITSTASIGVDLRNLGASGGSGGSGNATGGSSSGGSSGGSGGASLYTNGDTPGGWSNVNFSTYPGSAGSDAVTLWGTRIQGGQMTSVAGSGSGVGGITPFISTQYTNLVHYGIAPGAGGSGGTVAVGNGTGGNGGRGAGALYIECGGSLNISSTINASGSKGTDYTGGTLNGGGGGGAGGSIAIFYNALIANTGTYTVTAGAGGNGGASGGGVGFSLVTKNTEY